LKKRRERPQSKPLLVVLSGPSGVGKDAVLDRMKSQDRWLYFTVTATTRPRRSEELDGVNYYFVSRDRFQQMVSDGELMEWAEVYGNYYGVPRQQVEQALAGGRDVVVKVDVQGAMTIKRAMPQAVLIFLVAPSIEEMKARLRNRRTESAEDMERRIATASDEMRQRDQFDYVVVNDDVGRAVSKIEEIIRSEKRKLSQVG
jgi:guanylate kinase